MICMDTSICPANVAPARWDPKLATCTLPRNSVWTLTGLQSPPLPLKPSHAQKMALPIKSWSTPSTPQPVLAYPASTFHTGNMHMRCVQQISMELSWDNCLPSLFVLQCCIVSDTVLLRKKKKKKSMTHIYQMNLHWTSLSTLALFGSPPHTLSGRFLFIVKGAICWTPYSRKGQCCFAGACSSSSGSSAAFTLPNYYFTLQGRISAANSTRLKLTIAGWAPLFYIDFIKEKSNLWEELFLPSC